MTARRVVSLAAAVRVVDRVHGHAAGLRTLAPVTRPAGLAQLHQLVLGVAEHPMVARHFTGTIRISRKAQGGVGALLGHELDRGAGRATQLAAAARARLHVVDRGAGGDAAQRQRVAGAMSASSPELTVAPTDSRAGARM